MDKDFRRLLVLNIAPFCVSSVFFIIGAWIVLLFPVLQISFNIINYCSTTNVKTFLLLNLAMLVSSVANILISTGLYYVIVSPDSGTALVGSLFALIAMIIVVTMTLISVIFRIVTDRQDNKYGKG